MMLTKRLQTCGLAAIALAIVLPAGEPQPEMLIHEAFGNLDAWRPVTFENIARPRLPLALLDHTGVQHQQ